MLLSLPKVKVRCDHDDNSRLLELNRAVLQNNIVRHLNTKILIPDWVQGLIADFGLQQLGVFGVAKLDLHCVVNGQ